MHKKEGAILVLLLCVFFASFVSAESGMVVFQTSGAVATPNYQIWNEATFSSSFSATAVTGTLQWTVLKNNPVREEVILGTLDSNSDIKVQFYNSASNWSATSDMTLASGVNIYRAYDVAVEKASGDVMVAYDNNVDGQISYQVWNGSSWYKTGTVTTNLTGQINWINLVADRDNGVSNHIMMIAVDANSDLIAMEWNGTGWSISHLLETTLETATKEDFAVAYEDSGDALIVWADAATDRLRYVTVSSNGVFSPEGAVSGSTAQTADFQWVRLTNYPNSDRIMACSVDAGADFNCVEWTGSGWGGVTEITAAGEYSDGVSFRNFDIVPDTSSNSFVLMYALNNVDAYNIIRCFGQTNCQAGVWETTVSLLAQGDIGTDTSWASLQYNPENVGKLIALMGSQNERTRWISQITCTNSANSCAADGASTSLTTASSNSYESQMFNYFGRRPTIQNISTSAIVAPSTLMTISANNVNDTNSNTLNFYCSISSSLPTSANTICTGGNITVSSPYAGTSCSFTSQSNAGTYDIYCRAYDGDWYSTVVNTTYVVSTVAPSTSIISVAGDTVASYFDTNGTDGATLINISGEADMTCKWAATDLAYSGMSNPCITTGTYATCNVTGISSEGFYTRYVACANSLGIGQSNSTNLDVGFFLDYSAPTTSDNSDSNIHSPPYIVTITEGDAVDTDPFTLYCVDSVGTCTPNIGIDNLGQVTFTTRGVNYLRYNSSDDAGNIQAVTNKTININRLPIFTSAIDNSTSIKGGDTVLISTVSSDSDASQELILHVCSSPGANASGCTGITLCSNLSGFSSNVICSFASETDTAVHNWYAYLFDELEEAAISNPLTGFYSTDSSGPTITIISPLNQTYSSVNLTAEISTSETSVWAGYSLDGLNNATMVNISSTSFTASLTNLDFGIHNITFYANDSYGNFGVSAIRYFTIQTPVDITAPSLTIISPLNASYTSSTGTYVNISSDEALSWAGYTLNGGSLTNLTNFSSTIWYVNLTSLSQETTYTLVVYGNDSANNQGSRTSVFYADSLAPRYSAVSASPNPTNVSIAVNCSIYWNDSYSISSVIISENSLGSFENHTISFSGNSGVASYLIIGNKLTTPGNYTCLFYATDVAGNTNSTSTNFTVNDVTAPVLIVTSPLNGGVYNQLTVPLSLVSNEALSLAVYSLNGSANVSLGNTSATNWNSTLDVVNNQAYSIIFYGNDSFGNLGYSSTIVFSVNLSVLDTIPPVVTITSITNASYKSLSGLILNVTVNENVSSINYSLNGGANISMTNTSMFNWNATLADLTQESTNILNVYATGLSGNIGFASVTFYADTLAPRFVNTSTIPNPANETQNVVCEAYLNDSFGFSSVKISENATSFGNFINHSIDLTSSGYANYTIFNVVKGNYTCIFYVRDVAGNANSTSRDFAVNDVVAPILTINSPISQNYSTSSIIFSLTTSENVVSAKYSLDSGVTNVSLVGSGVSWSKTSTLGDGSYNITFYANDSFGNEGSANVSIVVDTSVNDLVAPTITIWSPIANSYNLDGSVVLNISSNEALSWAGYTNNSGNLIGLTNTSMFNWNATVDFAEGIHIIVFYANDTSTNKNQGTRNVTVYVDLNNASVDSFDCDTSVNDSKNLTCNASVSDAVGLDYAILSYNFSGSFVNSSQIDLIGTSTSLNYTFTEGNYSIPGNYTVQLYLFDLAGRMNDSSSDIVHVRDDVAPIINNYTYLPSDSDSLDPGVTLTVNASIDEDYLLNSLYLMYKNETDSSWNFVEMTNTTLADYNTTLVLPSGNVTIKINATDSYGNVNVSYNTTFEVALDISQNVTTNISVVKSFTFAERSDANELGYIILNTTSDSGLTYNFTISAVSELDRFNLNNTFNQTENYSTSSGDVLYIPLYVNLTGLTSGLYPFNITVSSAAGIEVFGRNLNVQSASGPYLSASIDTYSSRVTRGETGVEYSVTVTNLGTSDAQGVYLNWSLPTGFSLASGSLERSLATLPVGVSGTNTITLDVLSNISDSNLTIYATASSINADSVNASKVVTITNPLTVTQVVEVPGSSSGGGGGGATAGGGGAAIVYYKTIEVVRGNKTSFTIEFGNNKINKTLMNVIINLTGFPEKYMQITPSSFANVYYGENKSFEVLLTAPSYKSYEEHILKAVIKGNLVGGNSQETYTETQNIRLIIQQISKEEALTQLQVANSSILAMKEKGFNTIEMEKLFNQAKNKLDVDLHNKESYDISAKVVKIQETAFEARKLIDLIRRILNNPDEINLLTGNAVADSATQNSIFYSKEIEDILSMADSAFDRGDYTTALERAQKAELILRLEQKGNVLVFFYLYWPQILFALVVLLIFGKILYSRYSRNKVSSKIKDLNREEENINQLMIDNQNKYFSGKISSSEFHSRANQYHNRLAVLRKARINLRNKRIKLLAPQEFAKELDGEKKEVEQEIMKIQNSFYKSKNLSEEGYKSEFDLLNNRLAEIEDERIVVDVNKNHAEYKKKGFFSSLFSRRNEKKEQELKGKIDNLLKSREGHRK